VKLPYGIADFKSLITSGYTYVDRTQHIGTLESFGRTLLFVRPRRFGKSLWLQTLANWYDLRTADEHEKLFGHLAAGRGDTGEAHRYFVLYWNFSNVGPRGSRGPQTIDRLVHELDEYLLGTVEAFLIRYRDHLPTPVTVESSLMRTLTKLLAVVQQTPYPLYLLIDEYDNFANEVMMTDEEAYSRLVKADGPFKQLMKWVKQATEGQGVERLFLTGVTPVVLSDLTSGLNIAKNVSLEPELHALAGFTEDDVRRLLEEVVEDRQKLGKSTEIVAADALDMIRTWYNGYRFAPDAEDSIYNPTLALYYLDHLQRRGSYPTQMLDDNLAADENKLEYISQVTAGKKVVVDLLRANQPLEVPHIEGRFTMQRIVEQADGDSAYLGSFLYYFGMLTLVGKTARRWLQLAPPNLVIRKLYLDKVLRLLLPETTEVSAVHRSAGELMENGDLEPLLDFVEHRLFPSFGRRDYLHMNELTVKTTFMALLFDDVNYMMLSEPSIRTPTGGKPGQEKQGYADLVLLLRPDARSTPLWDLVLEFKYVSIADLGKSARDLDGFSREELAALVPVKAALAEADEQLRRYRAGLTKRFRELRLRSFAVVSIGFERLLGQELIPEPNEHLVESPTDG
jgi:hypothetical protein